MWYTKLMNKNAEIYFEKAKESFIGARSELINGRYNNCANRSYYACFQAAIYALLTHGAVALQNKWKHEFVKGQFVLLLINRSKKYPGSLRKSLEYCYERRQIADYDRSPITAIQAQRSLKVARDFVENILGREVISQ